MYKNDLITADTRVQVGFAVSQKDNLEHYAPTWSTSSASVTTSGAMWGGGAWGRSIPIVINVTIVTPSGRVDAALPWNAVTMGTVAGSGAGSTVSTSSRTMTSTLCRLCGFKTQTYLNGCF